MHALLIVLLLLCVFGNLRRHQNNNEEFQVLQLATTGLSGGGGLDTLAPIHGDVPLSIIQGVRHIRSVDRTSSPI